LQIPLVAVGTAEAFHAVQSDDQLANRFEPTRLPPWHDGEEYRQLLSTLEALLPLRRPSQLANTGLAEKILAAAEGILGEVVSIVSRVSVFRNARTDRSRCISKNNVFGWLAMYHNFELTVRCATIAYRVHKQPEGD
jgi:hypothetical protein